MMPAPFDPARILAVLGRHGVDFVVVGGLAAAIRGSPAMTNDADIVPERSPQNLERLSAALVELDARLRTESTPDGVPFDPHPSLLAGMALLNLTTRHGDLDLTFHPVGLGGYEEIFGASDEYDLDGHRVQVAALADVIRSKEAADRPRDRATLPILYALAEELADGDH